MHDQFIHEDLVGRTSLHNQYIVMRHGRAGSNEDGILIATSDPRFGLTDQGKAQVIEAAKWMFPLPSIIVASDTPRGAQTGLLTCDTLPVKPALRLDPRLRERRWGEHEGKPEHHCFAIYEQDRLDLESHPHNAEPVAEMIGQLSSLIVDLEREFKGQRILLVSHCDPIQVLQLIFSGKRVGHYIEMPEFKCAEFRQVEFVPRKTAAKAAVDRLLDETNSWANPAQRGNEPALA